MQADPIEKRVYVLEEKFEAIPDALNIRFARVDRQLAEMREEQAMHGQRLSMIERSLDHIRRRFDDLGNQVPAILELLRAMGGSSPPRTG